MPSDKDIERRSLEAFDKTVDGLRILANNWKRETEIAESKLEGSTADLDHALQRVKEINSENDSLKKLVEAKALLVKELKEQVSKLHIAQQANIGLIQEVEVANQKLTEVTGELKDQQRIVAHLREVLMEHAACSTVIDDLTAQLSDQKEQVKGYEISVHSLRSSLNTYQEMVEELKNKLQGPYTMSSMGKISALEREVEKLTKENMLLAEESRAVR